MDSYTYYENILKEESFFDNKYKRLKQSDALFQIIDAELNIEPFSIENVPFLIFTKKMIDTYKRDDKIEYVNVVDAFFFVSLIYGRLKGNFKETLDELENHYLNFLFRNAVFQNFRSKDSAISAIATKLLGIENMLKQKENKRITYLAKQSEKSDLTKIDKVESDEDISFKNKELRRNDVNKGKPTNDLNRENSMEKGFNENNNIRMENRNSTIIEQPIADKQQKSQNDKQSNVYSITNKKEDSNVCSEELVRKQFRVIEQRELIIGEREKEVKEEEDRLRKRLRDVVQKENLISIKTLDVERKLNEVMKKTQYLQQMEEDIRIREKDLQKKEAESVLKGNKILKREEELKNFQNTLSKKEAQITKLPAYTATIYNYNQLKNQAREKWERDQTKLDEALVNMQEKMQKSLKHIMEFKTDMYEQYIKQFAIAEIGTYNMVCDLYDSTEIKSHNSDDQEIFIALNNYEQIIHQIEDNLDNFSIDIIKSTPGTTLNGNIHSIVNTNSFKAKKAVVKNSVRSGFIYKSIVLQKEKVEVTDNENRD